MRSREFTALQCATTLARHNSTARRVTIEREDGLPDAAQLRLQLLRFTSQCCQNIHSVLLLDLINPHNFVHEAISLNPPDQLTKPNPVTTRRRATVIPIRERERELRPDRAEVLVQEK
jgi:hypothetical protein